LSDKGRGLAKRSLAGMLWTALSMGALAISEALALVVLARLLSPNEFGLYAAALVVIKFTVIFEGLGLGPAIVQRPSIEERHLRVGFTLSLLLSFLTAGTIWLIAPVIAAFLRLAELAPVVRGASVVFICYCLSMVAQAMAQRALRFRWLAGIDACAFAIGFVVIGPLLAWYSFGVWALVGALVTQHFTRTVLLLIGQPHPKRPLLERKAIADLLFFGGGFTLARVCNFLAGQVDKLIVGRFLGAQALGLYALASQLMTAPAVIFGQILDRVLFPTMALVQQEQSRLARAYRSGVAACALFTMPAGVILAIIAPELVFVLLGNGWEGVVVPFQILALGMFFRTSYKLSDTIARATGAVYARAWRQAVFAIAIAVGSLIGQLWGLPGVVLGVIAGVATNYFFMAQLSLVLTGMSWSDFARAHAPGMVLASALGFIVWAVVTHLRALKISAIVVLVDATMLSIILSLSFCWLLPALFLGDDGRSAVRVLSTLMPSWFRQRPSCPDA
jgi:PST family polysaccharide transporter